jgi:hypothetical protein
MRSLMTVFALVVLLLGDARADDRKPPDPATGVINGRIALLYWPVLSADKDREPQLLSPEGCRIHLIPADEPAVEHQYPCGEWFQPPIGSYDAWLETADRVSPQWTVVYGGAPAESGLAGLVPVFAAGRVSLPAGHSLAPGEEVRLLSLDGHQTMKSDRIFERRLRREEKTVLMPAGRIIAGRFDQKSGDAVALSRPTPLAAGKMVSVWPEPPAKGSDLLVILRRPSRTGGAADTAMFIDDGEQRRPADVSLDVNRIVAIWYGIDARTVTVSLRAQNVAWPRQEVRLVPLRVSTLRSRAERPPKLGVSLTVPDITMLPNSLSVSVNLLEDERLLATTAMTPGSPVQFDALPPQAVRVTLHVGEWSFLREVDLSAGDGDAVFDLEPITIHGTVFLGDDPVAAELRFHNRGEWINVRTDDRGAYRATVWQPGYYTLRIAITGSTRAPFTQHFTAIDESGRRDFHLPRNDYALTVRDADRQTPIAGAAVKAGNIWLDEAGAEQSLLDALATDENGSATFAPLRPGRLLLTVTAKGYAAGQLERAVLADDAQRHELTVALQPLNAAHRLRLLSPTGEPLAGAELWAFAGNDVATPVWQAGTGDDGFVDIPDRLQDAVFLIRHPTIASTARRWSGVGLEVTEWRTETPAPPLTTWITKPDGTAARSARVALWLDGLRLSGPPLAFTTWSSPAADPQGRWIARNLPRVPTRLLALPQGASTESRAFDTMATAIPFPWESPTAVTTIE